MQLFCRAGRVIAAHDDGQAVPASAYGEDVSIVPAPAGYVLEVGGAVPDLDLAQYATAKRYAVETAGITVSGQTILTDRQSQAMINGAFNLVNAMPQSIQFKGAAGFVTLTPEDVIAIGVAVGQHVQICFAKEAEVLDAITAGTITTPAEIDAAFETL